jgi:hypothetical protein
MSLTIIDNIKTCNDLKDGMYGFGMYQLTMDILKSQGKENSAEYLDAKQKYDVQKSKYDSLGCAVDKESMDCIALSEQIESMINLISTESKLALYDNRKLSEIEGYKKILAQYKLDFETKGCLLVLNKIAQTETNKTISQFTALDEARISEETKYQTQQRVFFGGLVLVVGLLIITMFNGKKK